MDSIRCKTGLVSGGFYKNASELRLKGSNRLPKRGAGELQSQGRLWKVAGLNDCNEPTELSKPGFFGLMARHVLDRSAVGNAQHSTGKDILG